MPLSSLTNRIILSSIFFNSLFYASSPAKDVLSYYFLMPITQYICSTTRLRSIYCKGGAVSALFSKEVSL